MRRDDSVRLDGRDPQGEMLTVVGISHRSAPVEIREQAAIADAELPDVLRALGDGVVLSTCNRTEIYQSGDQNVTSGVVGEFFRARLGHTHAGGESYLYRRSGQSALRHLFAVVAGLDSLVFGESQILGQARLALDAAQAAGTAGPVLSLAFRSALRVGRRARAETFVGRHPLSVSSAAVDLAREVFGELRNCRALVVGAGEMGELTTRALVDHGIGWLAVANRSFERAEALASRFGGGAVRLEELGAALDTADIVITSTDASNYVVPAALVGDVLGRGRSRPLFLIDIAVPRNVDPRAREMTGVVLYDIDDLRVRCEHNLERRRQEGRRVEAIMDEEARRFTAWLAARPVVPTIVALRASAERARVAELKEALARLPNLDEAERKVVEDMSRAIVNKLLHSPTVRLRQGIARGDDRSADVRALFGLEDP